MGAAFNRGLIDAPRTGAYNTVMRSPFFPRMDPYLEQSALWPDVHDRLHERARFDLGQDFSQPPVPPLSEADAAWARELIQRVA